MKLFSDSKPLMDKLNRFRKQRELETDPLVRFCVKPGCDGHMKAESISVRKVTCEKCQTVVCFKCREEYHGWWTSCEKNMEKKYKELAKGDINISFCPMCKAKISKNEGCNHMSCVICHYQWCWICGATYTDNHFNPLNPLGCGGQHFTEKRVWYIQIWINLGWLLFALIALPIILVFALPVLCASCICQQRRTAEYFFSTTWPMFILGILLTILCFCLGVVADLIVVPLVIVFGIPYFIITQCYEKYKVRKRAKETFKRVHQNGG